MEKARKLLMALINASVFSDFSYDFSKNVTSEVLEKTIKLANYHGVLHLVSDGLLKSEIDLDEELKEACRKKVMQALLRCESICFEISKACEILENAKIAHMALKGAVLRSKYPEKWMRNSCDIDILVKKEDLKRATDVLCDKLSCRDIKKTTHDVSLWTENDMHLELHFDLIERDYKKNGKYLRKWNCDCLSDVWNDASLAEGKEYLYEMSDGMLYFYHIAHMAKHIENGGCGIRPLIDLKILDESDEIDAQKRRELLENGNLTEFCNCLKSLYSAWFSNGEMSDSLKVFEDYVFLGGAYGTKQNSVAYNSSKTEKGLDYARHRIWVSKEFLRYYYPKIEKKPYLMPFCQVGRWIKIIKRGRFSKSVRELKMNNNVLEETRVKMKEMIETLKL